MTERPFDRETLLDITVNAIPFGMLVFFLILFLVVTPWGDLFEDLFTTGYVVGHMLFTMIGLALITYVGAYFISRDEP